MSERTEDEEIIISLKMVEKLSKEAGELWKRGDFKAANVILDFLVIADKKLLILYHDIVKQIIDE